MASTNDTFANANISSFFGNGTQPVGSDFKDPVLVAAIVVNGICAVSFASLVIATWWIKDKKTRGRRVFGVISGIIVTMLLLVPPIIDLVKYLAGNVLKGIHLHLTSSYLRTTADEVTLELNENKPAVHIALVVIEQVLSGGTDSALPFVVYKVIKNRLAHLENHDKSYSTTNYIHTGVAILLAGFRIVDAFLAAYGQVFIQINTPEVAWGINISNWYKNIHLTYASLFCAVALEMFACAVFIFNKSRPKKVQSRSKITKYLVAIVTPFLVIRCAVTVAFAIIYVYFAHNAQKSFGLINAILLGIPSVILYLGLVLIGLADDWDLAEAPVTYGNGLQDGYGSAAVVTQQYDGGAKQPFARTTRVR